MGLLDDANKLIEEEENKKNDDAAWKNAGASKYDQVAFELTEDEKQLVEEFIKSVPEECWNSYDCSDYILYGTFSITGAYFYKYYGYARKYVAPDNTVRLCTRYNEEPVPNRFGKMHTDTRKSEINISEIGDQLSVRNVHRDIAVNVFKDGTLFVGLRNNSLVDAHKILSDKDFFVSWLRDLIKSKDKVMKSRQHEEEERKKEAERLQRCKENRLCRFCNQKLGLFNRRCKQCEQDN